MGCEVNKRPLDKSRTLRPLHHKAECKVARGGGIGHSAVFGQAIDSLNSTEIGQCRQIGFRVRSECGWSLGRSDIYEEEHQKRWEPSASVERTDVGRSEYGRGRPTNRKGVRDVITNSRVPPPTNYLPSVCPYITHPSSPLLPPAD